jgi:hypothetical protein
VVVAEPRDVDAVALGGVDDQLAGPGVDRLAVDGDGDGGLGGAVSQTPAASSEVARRDGADERRALDLDGDLGGTAEVGLELVRKRMTAEAIGDVADWPSGQMVVCLGGQFMPTEMLSRRRGAG